MVKSRLHKFEANDLQLFTSRQIYILSFGISILIIFTISASAHEPVLHFQEVSEPQATSVLDSVKQNGRIGGYLYQGSFKPIPAPPSRFSNNARYGSAGNIVGFERNSATSRFSDRNARQNQSQIDFNLLALRNELQRSQLNRKAPPQANTQPFDSGVPRMVRAPIPQSFPYNSNRRPLYGKYLDSPTGGQDTIANETFSDNSQPLSSSDLDISSSSPQLLWMRGRIPQNELTSTNEQNAENDAFPQSLSGAYSRNDEETHETFISSSSLLGGSLHSPIETNNAIPSRSVPTHEQLLQSFREYLEAQLLRSPDVNPLSPVLVSYQNGVATVRGVVPNPSAREAAGLILLSDPRVSKVNNLMTCVHNDNSPPMTIPKN